MSSTNSDDSHAGNRPANLPTIKLDTTLTDLYRRASRQSTEKRIGQALCGVNCNMDLNPDFPRNVKFLYQDGPFTATPQQPVEDKRDLRRSLAMKYLGLVPQRDAFICGDTAVVLFNVDQTEGQVAHDRREAETTVAVLDAAQRPELIFCSGPAHIPLREAGIDLLAYKVALDALDAYPLAVDLETHWFLNSKAALALSGLPTPPAEVIEVAGFGLDAAVCCDVCAAGGSDLLVISPKCTGDRGRWLMEQSGRMLEQIRARQVPFVVKNQQTFGGAGTWVVEDETQKAKLLEDLGGEEGVLWRLLSMVTKENHHMAPGSLIISDLVKDPSGDYGLTFFVTDSGESIFLAVSEQMTDDNNAWFGSTINYHHQDKMRKKFACIMEQTTAWLVKHGYFGPVGGDILETRTPCSSDQNGDSANGGSTHQYIVDLNVRTSGSLCLPLLRGHFTSRNLFSASSFSITVKETRQDFIAQWPSEFESGQMCILSWYEDRESGKSIADIAMGGHDKESLLALMAKVQSTTEEITF